MKTLLTRLIACIAFTFLLPTAHAGPTHELVVGFEVPPARPSKNALTLAPDGYLWGTTYGGGAHGGGNYRKGTIYKVKPDGSGMRIVYSFNYNDEFLVDVAVQPRSNSGLVDDGYGNLWGTERYGGSAESGSVFKVNVFTEIVTTVASFTNGSDSSRGANPTSNGLASDGNGFLWGTTLRGGSYGFGTVFKVNVSTGQLATVLDFPSASGTISTLVSDGRGFMWGTAGGGYLKNGEVFKINTQTGILTTVKQFTGTSGAAKGANPLGGMIRSNTGLFWGTTSRGGSSGAGTVFKIDPVTEIFTTVYEFSAANATPSYGLAADASGNIWGTSAYSVFRINPLSNAYFPIDAGVSGPGSLMIYGNTVFGTAVNRLGSVFKIDLSRSLSLTTILSFSYPTGGPESGLVSDRAGLLWGTMAHGRSFLQIEPTSGKVSTVVPIPNELNYPPSAALVRSGDYFWGSTAYGGDSNLGMVFKIHSATRAFSKVVSFTGTTESRSYAPLVSDGVGSLWGTTVYGGALNKGTVFKVNETTGVKISVAEFSGNGAQNKGSRPYGALLRDTLGNFWGTTNSGGTNDYGTVFKLDVQTGELSTVVEFSYDNGVMEGAFPYAGLTSDGAGYFWGVTESGGANRSGTVFKINTATGSAQTVADFTTQGAQPIAALVNNGDGFLWGTASYTAQNYVGNGTVFKVSIATGELIKVLDFTGVGSQANSGEYPGGGSLLKHSDGNLYGTTTGGGPGGGGTVYRLRFGPAPKTVAATDVSFTSAVIRGAVSPNGNPTTFAFEYGTSPTLAAGTVVGEAATADATHTQDAIAEATGLVPGTTYYYRIRAENAENSVPQHGEILSFTTVADTIAPVITPPADFTAEATGPEGAAVYFPLAEIDEPFLASEPVYSPENGAVFPVGTTTVHISARDTSGHESVASFRVTVADTIAPSIVADLAGTRIVEGTPMPDFTALAEITDAVGVTNVRQIPASGSATHEGNVNVSITARDAAGNVASYTFPLGIRLAKPLHTARHAAGQRVQSSDRRIPRGAVWTRLGSPTVNDAGHIAFVGKWSAPTASGTGIFLGEKLIALEGDTVPGIRGAKWRQFKAPVLDPATDAVIFRADIADGAAHNEVLVLASPGQTLQILARQNAVSPEADGARWAKFSSASLKHGRVLLTASLQKTTARARNGAWQWTPETGWRRVIREGFALPAFADTEKVRSFSLLRSLSGAPGAGGADQAADGTIAMNVVLSSGYHALISEKNGAVRVSGETVSTQLEGGEKWATFGTLITAADDGALALRATFTNGRAGIFTAATDSAGVLDFTSIAQLGDIAPNTDWQFATLSDPVISRTDAGIAFTATTSFRKTVWWKPAYAPLRAIAIGGETPPDASPDSAWIDFPSIAMMGGERGPLFTANVRTNAGKFNALYAVTSAGDTREIIRDNAKVGTKTLQTFHAIKAITGSVGIARSFNKTGSIVWLATFTDGTTAVMQTRVP